METLQQIWERLAKEGYETDKGSVHSYIPIYEKILASYRETAKYFLEIGLFKGDSLRMWERYFINAMVHGIDCNETPHGGLADLRTMIESGNHLVNIIDATDKKAIDSIYFHIKFDVIIEDAGHEMNQQIELYNIWKRRLTPYGIYIIEDIQDIDKDFETFQNIDPEKDVTILDIRASKGRYDDVLCIITKKA